MGKTITRRNENPTIRKQTNEILLGLRDHGQVRFIHPRECKLPMGDSLPSNLCYLPADGDYGDTLNELGPDFYEVERRRGIIEFRCHVRYTTVKRPVSRTITSVRRLC